MQNAIEVKNLKVVFPDRGRMIRAVEGVDLTVKKGECLALVGESGCGKSMTSLSCMKLQPSLAAVRLDQLCICGEDVTDYTDRQMQALRGSKISMIFQDSGAMMNPTRKVGKVFTEYILTHEKISKKEAWSKGIAMLERMRLPSPDNIMESYPFQLSGGMRQRVVIAIALACEPKLLIADEPTTALDVTIQAQILELMQDLRKKLGMSIIMITHDLGVVASMCEKIAVMYAGHIVEYGTTDEIFYQPGHEYTKGLINSIPKLNTAEHERLVPIEGTPVDLLNPPAGCPFAPRCKNCMKICLSKMPPRTELSDTHYTYCWLQQKAAFEKGEKAE